MLNPNQKERIFQLFIKDSKGIKDFTVRVSRIAKTTKISEHQVLNALLSHLAQLLKEDLFTKK